MRNTLNIGRIGEQSKSIYLHRFGFNGKEKVDEIAGTTGSHLDFGARIYDSRIGRWMAVDPLQTRYPYLSPYSFVANMPMIAIDPNGEEIQVVVEYDDGRQSEPIVWCPGDAVPTGATTQTAKIYQSLQFLNDNAGTGGNELISGLVDNEKVVTINGVESTRDTYDSEKGKVEYNPNVGLVVKSSGKRMSPVVALAHELGHAEQEFKLIDAENNAIAALDAAKESGVKDNIKIARKALRKASNELYYYYKEQDIEEQRNINSETSREKQVANKLGQGERKDHNDDSGLYKASDISSTEGDAIKEDK